MHKVVKFSLAGDYRIRLVFEDNTEKIIDFKPLLGKGISSELLDPEAFSEVEIESGGGLAWPNGFDACPNYLYDYKEDIAAAYTKAVA